MTHSDPWKPISTAPKNTLIWVKTENAEFLARGSRAEGFIVDGYSEYYVQPEPTHWREV